MSVLSLGLIETRGLVAAIEAADAAVKAANITLLSAELLGGGIVTLRMQGDLGAVQAAVDAGAQAAKRIGEVIAVRVIPRPVGELSQLSAESSPLSAMPSRPVAKVERIAEAHADSPALSISKSRPAATQTPAKPKPSVIKSQTPAKPVSAPRIEPPVVTAPATIHHAPATVSRAQYDFSELEAMPVVRLRQFARSVKNLGIQGRQISMANKTQLLEAIRNAAGH